jgi:DNA recombination protein RmuC
MRRMGSSLDAAVGHYNKMVGSYDGRVMVTARRMAEHGIGEGALPEPAPITQRARETAAADAPTPSEAARTTPAVVALP